MSDKKINEFVQKEIDALRLENKMGYIVNIYEVNLQNDGYSFRGDNGNFVSIVRPKNHVFSNEELKDIISKLS